MGVQIKSLPVELQLALSEKGDRSDDVFSEEKCEVVHLLSAKGMARRNIDKDVRNVIWSRTKELKDRDISMVTFLFKTKREIENEMAYVKEERAKMDNDPSTFSFEEYTSLVHKYEELTENKVSSPSEESDQSLEGAIRGHVLKVAQALKKIYIPKYLLLLEQYERRLEQKYAQDLEKAFEVAYLANLHGNLRIRPKEYNSRPEPSKWNWSEATANTCDVRKELFREFGPTEEMSAEVGKRHAAALSLILALVPDH